MLRTDWWLSGVGDDGGEMDEGDQKVSTSSYKTNARRGYVIVRWLRTWPLRDLREYMTDWTAAISNEENWLYLNVPALPRPLCLW